jgi:4-diphosphocytidyl-2C-methyl-D-erythritol kinase
MMSDVLTIQTYAKINLILRVSPPTPQGMHPIGSWMHSIDLSDTISIERIGDSASEFDIRWSDGKSVQWEIESDLVYKAHASFEQCVSRSTSQPEGGWAEDRPTPRESSWRSMN